MEATGPANKRSLSLELFGQRFTVVSDNDEARVRDIVAFVNRRLEEIRESSKRVQTGYRVADAQDDAAVFAVAQGIRGDIKAKASVQSSLAGGEGLAQVTNAALKGISDVIGDIRAKLALLGSDSISDDQRAIYQEDVTQLTATMTSYTTQANFTQTMLISCYSFTALAQRAEKLMRAGGSLLTLTYYGAEKVMPHYNVMGVAKAALEASVRYLAADLGRNGIRVNAISAGPIKTLAASGIADFRYILRWNEYNSALRRTVRA